MNPTFPLEIPVPCRLTPTQHDFSARRASTLKHEFVVTDRQWPGETVLHPFRRLAAEIKAREAQLLSLMLYGALTAREEIERALTAALGRVEWPVTWVDSEGTDSGQLAGLQAFVISGAEVSRIRLGNLVVGSVFSDGNARHCLLGGLGPTETGIDAAAQTQQTFGNLEWALGFANFKLSDVVRTWFYNDDIVAWYGDFNRVRSSHYKQADFRTKATPASTGIGARNPAGAALTLAAWAVQPLDATALVRAVGSPLQCPAPAYGSSFSRALELVSGGCRRLFISGTASIWPDGKTAWDSDPAKQIALTMKVVAAILESRGMDYRHITRATAYFDDASFQKLFDLWCEANELRRLPVIALKADVCRADLLFEIEIDAMIAVENGHAENVFEI